MRVRIYQPAKTAMQSGYGRSHGWRLDFEPADARGIDPLMGWTTSDDPRSQVHLRFDTREAAEAYAKENGYEYTVIAPHARAHTVRPRGYGENFASDRRANWTH